MNALVPTPQNEPKDVHPQNTPMDGHEGVLAGRRARGKQGMMEK